MNKYEQLIEHIINDEADKARELFHTIVVEKSRDIYESLIDEQDLEEVGGNPVEGLAQDIQMDEEGIAEEEDVLDLDQEEGSEEDHHDDVGGDEELEDRVMDLEDALDELKAEFDALMAGEEHEEEHGDMFGGEEDGEEELDEAKCAMEEEEDEEDEEMDESIVREYVEKVADQGQKSEGGEVGKGGSANVNKQSTVAGKNDMGGSSANIAKGGAESNPDGTSPKATAKPKGELVSNPLNKPGSNAGKAFAHKETAVKKEESGVNKTTPVAK